MFVNPNLEDAVELWSFTQDVKLVKKAKSTTLGRIGLRQLISDVSTKPIDYIANPNKEVIKVAQFIANIEPNYTNSSGQLVELFHLRTNIHMPEEDIQYVCEKIEEIVKPFIVVSSTDTKRTNRLVVNTSLSKKKLIHRAVRHLLLGSEVFKDPNEYHQVKGNSLFMENIKASYGYLIGLAISIGYDSVPLMMEDLCIQFVDQTKKVEATGQVQFYDGALRVENL